ncbi:RIP metalloprotease RseP [Effusibacillus dendaii]|uniref:Zinc metalloprotease n=1 Tax=Effusibacillus dendaii TaxID=2743772 RepID=A0A7I8DCX3_9BACL|nr:RIP metalloprotease RseP [Effusibacillus dendaii]BCJ87132.1 zinc metalloprotease [Effusibacillus dendaii]
MNIIMALLALGILIFIHELGHYWAARATGVRVEEFAIGFGPPLVRYRKNNILYRLNLLPLGGYVKMLGEDNPEAAEAPDNFNNRPLLARMLVILAGVIMNFIGAIVILTVMFNLYGAPTDKVNTHAFGVVPGSPAQVAGIQANDILKRINGVPIDSPQVFIQQVQANNGKPVTLEILRDKQMVTLQVTPVNGKVGIEIGTSPVYQSYGSFAANTSAAIRQTGELARLVVSGLGQLVTGQFAFKDLTGPVGIIEVTGQASQLGVPSYLHIMALLSVNLGVLNLVPIPGLDGGRFLFLLIEAIRRGKRLSLEREASINLIGILFLLGLMVIVTFQDVFKLIAR